MNTKAKELIEESIKQIDEHITKSINPATGARDSQESVASMLSIKQKYVELLIKHNLL